MSRRWLCAVVVVVCLPFFTGCGLSRSVRENREISRLIRKDIIDYYENMSQAYWVLGLGFYRLSQLAREQNDLKAASLYRNNAVMYKRHSEDLQRTAEIWREDYGLDKAPENVPIEPTDWSDFGLPTEEVKPDAVKPVEPPPDPLPSLDSIPEVPAVETDDTSTGPDSGDVAVPAETEPAKPDWIERLKFWRKNK